MKKIFLLLILALLCSSISISQQVEPVRIRVLTYNILHGATMNNDFDLVKIAKVIRDADPNIVALQEVDRKTKRAHNFDLVTELGKLTGMLPHFGPAMPYDGGEYGEGLLSKYSFRATRNYALSAIPEHEPRAALEVLIELPGGARFTFTGTHLDHTEDSSDRERQATELNEIYKDSELPAILAGDLNGEPHSESMAILFKEWTDACSENPEMTYPSVGPIKRIDYVLFRPAHRWRVIETKVIEEEVASDHRPLLVVLELLPENHK